MHLSRFVKHGAGADAGRRRGRERIVLVLEGRDGAGKDSAIKRITRYLAVRATASSAGGN